MGPLVKLRAGFQPALWRAPLLEKAMSFAQRVAAQGGVLVDPAVFARLFCCFEQHAGNVGVIRYPARMP
jgi:hypothetical protein